MSGPASRYAGGLQSVYKKYAVVSPGIWDRVRKILAVDPNRSWGIPLNPTYRNPSPASVPAKYYTDPVTIPAGDIAGNPYWQRDTRRNYPRIATFKQNDIVGLLELGSKATPRISDGEAGEKQLVAVKEAGEGGLAAVFQNGGIKVMGEVLGPSGLPPLPGGSTKLVQDKAAGFPEEYPCRNFK